MADNGRLSKLAVLVFIFAWPCLILSFLLGLPVMLMAGIASRRISRSNGQLYGQKWALGGLCISLVLSVGSCLILTNARDAAMDASTKSVVKAASLPNLYVVDEELVDGPFKTQVLEHLLVKQVVTGQQVRELLLNRWRVVRKRTGFKHHNYPTHVALYLFDSEEAARAQSARQLGQLFWMEAEHGNNPEITLLKHNVDAQALRNQPAVVKHGLSEQKRRKIAQETYSAEKRADRGAYKQYPSDVARQIEYSDRLYEKYRSEIRKKYGITNQQLDDIMLEGGSKNWF